MRRLVITLILLLGTSPAWAGPIFLTGHDPDFHAQGSPGAQNLLRAGLSFVTGGTYNDNDPNTKKFLWVESRIPTPGGHLIGENGLIAVGLNAASHYDRANAAELAGANFSNYSAIAIASAFGGLLTRAELDGLIARSNDIKNFINAGGGLLALSECFPCGANLLDGQTAPDLFGYLPVEVSSVPPIGSFTVTPEGAAPPFGLVNSDVNDPTHNSFGLIGGLTPLDRDQGNQATTLAGDVQIGGGGFCGVPGTPPCPDGQVPGPASLLLVGPGLAGVAAVAWRRNHTK